MSGTGTFFVLVDPLPGGKIPDDLKIAIGVQPESGRLPEVVYAAARDDTRGQLEYKALAEFDRDEFWRVRLVLQSSQGSGEALSRVEATPPGFGRWDLLLYLLPFLAVGVLMVSRNHAHARSAGTRNCKWHDSFAQMSDSADSRRVRHLCDDSTADFDTATVQQSGCRRRLMPLVWSAGRSHRAAIPRPNCPTRIPKTYADVVSAFYIGLAALQVGDDVHAESKLSEVTQLVPGEPAGWANWGVLALRQRNYDTAAQRLERARDLAPENDRIYDLLGILESQRGQFRGSDRRLAQSGPT